uniref:DUF5683 domain-containing protein n=1 Tax=candidate division WOR-3 bacterium TaxID=2052148 RepID=A0A7C4XTI8_UNCW3
MTNHKKFFIIFAILFLANECLAREKLVRTAMLLSLFPGGGQFYTERYIPGFLIGTGEVTLGYLAYKNHRDGNYSERNSFLWWELFLFGYSLADAYVGAKMYGFDVETDLNKVSLSYNFFRLN